MADSIDVVSVATPLVRDPIPSVVEPLRKVTVPVGERPVPEALETVAIRVALVPWLIGPDTGARVTELVSLPTTTGTAAEVLVA